MCAVLDEPFARKAEEKSCEVWVPQTSNLSIYFNSEEFATITCSFFCVPYDVAVPSL